MANYGKTILSLRKKNNLTQAELGYKLNVSYQSVSKWENNLSQPDLETIDKMVNIFGVSISEFFAMSKDDIVETSSIAGNNDIITENAKKSSYSNFKKNIFIEKPWYLVALLTAIVIVLSLLVFLIPVKYSSSEIFAMVDPSVFCITAEQNSSTKKAGSGFFINNTGLAVTNYHVIENCTSATIQLNNGETYNVKNMVGCDADKDIAIIQIDVKTSKSVRFANSDRIKVGQTVYAIGYPESFELGSASSTFTQGIISKTSYSINGNNYIQATVNVSNGNSGGVLINEQGRVIGITTLMLSNGLIDYMNMSIPINEVTRVDRNLSCSLSDYIEISKIKKFYYYSNGSVIHTEECYYGDVIEPIDDPKRQGYLFDGWFTTASFETEFDFSQPISNTRHKCYAKWIANSFRIKFDGNGGRIKNGTMEDQIIEVNKGTCLTRNVYYIYGYELEYWQYGTRVFYDCQNMDNTFVAGDSITLVAIWKPIEYTIEFVYDGEVQQQSYVQSFTYGVAQTLLPNTFEQEYSIFDHWVCYQLGTSSSPFTFSDEEEVINLVGVSGRLTFYAVFRDFTYQIRYWTNARPSSNIPETITQTYNYSHEYSVYYLNYVPGNVGFTFLYWYDNDGRVYCPTSYVPEDVPSENVFKKICKLSNINEDVIDLYAVWQENSYDVYFATTPESSERIFFATKKYTEEFMLPTDIFETPDGYELTSYVTMFYNYTTQKYEVLKSFSIDEPVSELIDYVTIVLYPNYVAKSYNIYFDGNNADSGEMQNLVVQFDSDVTLPNCSFEKAGYLFYGWKLGDKTFIDNNVGKLIQTYQENVTLSAVWLKDLDGDGSEENPYQIKSCDDLKYLAKKPWSYFVHSYIKLMNDIDCEFEEIPAITSYAYINGDGHIISNIKYKDGYLFAENHGTINNLGVENFLVDMQSDEYECFVAGFISFNNGSVNSCFVRGEINLIHERTGWETYRINIAGFVRSNNGTIRNSYAEVEVNANIYSVNYFKLDGFVCFSTNNNNPIEFCYSNITANVNMFYCAYNASVMSFGNVLGSNFSKANIEVVIENVHNLTLDDASNNIPSTADSSITVELPTGTTEITLQKIANQYFIDEQWMKEHMFVDEADVWVYDGEHLPKLYFEQ